MILDEDSLYESMLDNNTQIGLINYGTVLFAANTSNITGIKLSIC
jgi:hypothetical protein